MKLLEKNTGETVQDKGRGKDMIKTREAQTLKETNRRYYIKPRRFCTAQKSLQKSKQEIFKKIKCL